MREEDFANMQEQTVDIPQVDLQFINKHTERAIHIHLKRILDVLLHRVWERVVLDDAEGLVRAEQSVGAGERLNHVNILHHLVHIERVHPLGVIAGEHLRHNDEQVNLLIMVTLDSHIRFLVGQALGHVLLVLAVGAQLEGRVILLVVIVQHLEQCILTRYPLVAVINVVVKDSHHVHRRVFVLEDVIIGYRFRNVLGRQDGVELLVLAQLVTVTHDIIGHGQMVDFLLVDVTGQIVFDTVPGLAVLSIVRHHLQLVHESVIDGHSVLIILYLFQALHPEHRECCTLAQVIVVIGVLPVEVKAQHITVGNTVGDSVLVQHVTE